MAQLVDTTIAYKLNVIKRASPNISRDAPSDSVFRKEFILPLHSLQLDPFAPLQYQM